MAKVESKINIVCSANARYFDYCLAMLASLVANSRASQKLCIYILVDRNFPKEKINCLKSNLAKLKVLVKIMVLETSMLKALPSVNYLTQEAYFRIIFADSVPDVKRFIYLDCDMIVRSSIEDLWEIDLGKNVIGAVHDSYLNDVYVSLGTPPYFNSGVILVDANKFRDLSLSRKIIKYLSGQSQIYYADQDGLNYALRGKWKKLPPEWNSMSMASHANPKIIHFNGGSFCKPDHPLCDNPYKAEYYKYLKQYGKYKIYIPASLSRKLKSFVSLFGL